MKIKRIMKKFLKGLNWVMLLSLLLFIVGVLMLSVVKEPTYEELVQPIPFTGMILCVFGILFTLISSVFEDLND